MGHKSIDGRFREEAITKFKIAYPRRVILSVRRISNGGFDDVKTYQIEWRKRKYRKVRTDVLD